MQHAWGTWEIHSFFLKTTSKSESESYITTDGQAASLSWNKAPTWGLRTYFYYFQTVACLLMWGALSDERTGMSFTIAAGSRQRSHSRSESRDTRDHILLSQIRVFPFRRLLLPAGLRWRYSIPPPLRRLSLKLFNETVIQRRLYT
jgi:hypothetical protein